MQEWKTAIESNFDFSPSVKCDTHDDTLILLEENEKTIIESYAVEFKTPGICIQNFDKVSKGNLFYGSSFDVLSVAQEKIRCIELKSGIGLSELKKLGEKFYYGHLKASSILLCISTQFPKTEYVVIYKKDMVESSQKQRENKELGKQKLENYDKAYVHAWNNNNVLLTEKTKEKALLYPFCDGEIPITKHHYDGSTPINFS